MNKNTTKRITNTVLVESTKVKESETTSGNSVKYNKILYVNDTQYSDLKWEDIAGLSLNVMEDVDVTV